ncbi:hypothetical protein DNU06_16040 [Putridiphycobacter roseus]|uniref:Uncharacterized protein n=1 Tax=Putridiphycobacter roseus TaxID=2219161 RepID=A0A2W1MUZ3_9FLAO|nr:hypothetical protein DNU06_16040 [Putridiphycobacter roseus]
MALISQNTEKLKQKLELTVLNIKIAWSYPCTELRNKLFLHQFLNKTGFTLLSFSAYAMLFLEINKGIPFKKHKLFNSSYPPQHKGHHPLTHAAKHGHTLPLAHV